MNVLSAIHGWSVVRGVVLSIFGIALIGGCVAGVGTGGTGTTTVAKSSAAHNTSPQVTSSDLAAVAAGTTEFALKTFPLLSSNLNENTFFSPYSVSQAFALLAPGAKGTTLSQIEQTMSFALPQDGFNPAFNKLNLLLAAKMPGTQQNGVQMPQWSNANGVWAQNGFPILPGYLDTLAVNYGAGLNLVDFIGATESARQTINEWASQNTNQRIQNLIPPNGVTGDTRMVLTNAIWFKANWAFPFQKEATASRTFLNRNGTSASVPFMNKILNLPYAQTAGCQAVDIPYAGNELSMLVIMPTSGSFDTFMATLNPAVLGNIVSQLQNKDVDLSMPKFTFTREASMGPMLQSLGMRDAFDLTRADFSGIDGQTDLFIGNVFHKAFIAVDEDGTEAAAATAIDMGTTGLPVVNLTLRIDHSFLFLIRDRQTGLILFIGKVGSL